MIGKIFFWPAVFLVFYNYAVYPALVFILSRLIDRPARTGDARPAITFIIAAYNEEKVITDKIRNTLALDYPRDRFQIIVVSDGSTDGTPAIAASFSGHGVISMHRPERRGKTAALNRAVAASTGDVIVFSDANNEFNANALVELTKFFADPAVGAVTGLKHIRLAKGRQSSVGDSLYWKYESAIKSAESRLGSVTAADGEILAIRRSLYEAIDESLINDDAAITFNVIKKGFRLLYETRAVSTEYASISLKDDFNVKVRMVAGGFQTLSYYSKFLWPPDSAFKIQFISHKVLRWLAPELMLIALIANVALISEPFYALLLLCQALFYLFAAIGFLFSRSGEVPRLFYIPLYFTVMNAAAFVGLLRYLNRSTQNIWRKAER